MANAEHLELLRLDIRSFQKWREEHPEVELDFSGADLSGKSLRERNFDGANFRWAKLVGGNLVWCSLKGANLGDVEAMMSNAEGADFSGANLRGADFRGARLRGSYYDDAQLIGANFSGTFIHSSVWVPVLRKLWDNATPKDQAVFLRALHAGTLARRLWSKDGLSCPKWLLIGGERNARVSDDFTQAWDSGALTHEQLFQALCITHEGLAEKI